MTVIQEEDILLENLFEGGPTCQALIRNQNFRPCGKPAAYRVRNICGGCRGITIVFLCQECRDITLHGQAGCSRCPGRVRLGEYL